MGYCQYIIRPIGAQNMTRPEVIKITLTAEEKTEIKAAAKSEGLDMASFARMAVLRLARQ